MFKYENLHHDYRKPETIYKDLRGRGASPLEAEIIVDDIVALRGGHSRRQILTGLLDDIIKANLDEVEVLRDRYGVRGGVNALRIPGWTKSPNGDISKAIKLCHHVAWRKGWPGGGTTPVVYIPECIVADAVKAWREVYCS